MAHCKYSDLQDLEAAFETIRTYEGVKEPKPGIFYLKSKGFLHFHIKDECRWADIRDGEAWGDKFFLPKKASRKDVQVFLKKIRDCYERSITKKTRKNK